jgi:hypothetical protein
MIYLYNRHLSLLITFCIYLLPSFYKINYGANFHEINGYYTQTDKYSGEIDPN